MVSIRLQLQRALRDRLATIPGWQVAMRKPENVLANSSVNAIVTFGGEDKRVDTSMTYIAQLFVVVLIFANDEDADAPSDFDNPYEYLDRLVTLAEQKVHEGEITVPGFQQVSIIGSGVVDPDERNERHATLRLMFEYRHAYTSPEAVV